MAVNINTNVQIYPSTTFRPESCGFSWKLEYQKYNLFLPNILVAMVTTYRTKPKSMNFPPFSVSKYITCNLVTTCAFSPHSVATYTTTHVKVNAQYFSYNKIWTCIRISKFIILFNSIQFSIQFIYLYYKGHQPTVHITYNI